MSIALTHIGEALTKELLGPAPPKFLAKYFGKKPISFQQEVPLEKFTGKAFDGMGKVDIVAQLSTDEAIAIEVKLGTTRMDRGRIRGWLGKNPKQECTHEGTRWRGNMIRFLDRWKGLTVRYDKNSLCLQDKWILVIRRSVYNRWYRNQILPPNGELISEQCVPIAFEYLVDNVGRVAFNRIARNLIPDDPYHKWDLASLKL